MESGKLSKKKMKKSRSYSEGFQPYDYTSTDYSLTEGTVHPHLLRVYISILLHSTLLVFKIYYVDIVKYRTGALIGACAYLFPQQENMRLYARSGAYKGKERSTPIVRIGISKHKFRRALQCVIDDVHMGHSLLDGGIYVWINHC